MLGQFRTLAMFLIHANIFEVRTVAGQSFSTRRKSCFSWNDRRRTSRQEQIIYGILILKFILRFIILSLCSTSRQEQNFSGIFIINFILAGVQEHQQRARYLSRFERPFGRGSLKSKSRQCGVMCVRYQSRSKSYHVMTFHKIPCFAVLTQHC